MFSVKFSFILIALFVLNMALRALHIEPYPTLLLPDGPSNIIKDDSNRINVTSRELYALNEKNSWSKINLDQLGHKMPVPTNYLGAINFGLNPPSSKVEKIKKMLDLTATPNNIENKQHFNAWFRKKISDQGFKTESVKIISFVTLVSLTSKEIVGKKITHEETFSLR